MKRILIVLAASWALTSFAQNQPPTTLRAVLLEQLRTVHNHKDWFVPVNVAVEGVTADQANWSDGKGNHSIGQLTYHLLYWNRRALADIKGENPGKFSGNNEETFDNFDTKQWSMTVRQLDDVMANLEKAVEAANEEQLTKNASLIAHVGTHTAYHVAQILYVRREQGSWDPAKGVK